MLSIKVKVVKAAINLTGGNPWLTFVIIIWLAGIVSAFVDNIPFATTMIPLPHSYEYVIVLL